ncbi:kinase-like domain-containing protein [Hypoxylon trugodes]|uniref:kinase-like domain-containing protein n=1 Tax=Hypoxylon trugodes TaxID=326681 RepID=UPI00219F5B4E|nr:kinase-like domain-containing protein [Hypoxylon trugodes]KAI1386761.1 kinase-like domain-containing protein [Hypoxylon trugodes]
MSTTQRLYLPAVDGGEVEEREKYRPGGYHPIHFNDHLGPNKRFLVVHKLGWNVNSTEWLCLDKRTMCHRSVKVMVAEQSVEDCPELQVLNALSEVSRNELEENCVAIPKEHFWVEGPNGRHLCFVSDLYGPSLYLDSPLGTGIHTPGILTDFTFQICKGIQYLHTKGICHGDLKPSNVRMRLHQYTLMELPYDRLDRYLGPRRHEPLLTPSGSSPGSHGPKYLALPVSLDKLEEKCRAAKVAIVDFSHSFHHSNPPKITRWNRQYAGPEFLFTETVSGFPRDIWALACTIYEIRTQKPFVSEYQDYTSLIRHMELLFGPLPTEYRGVAGSYLEGDKARRNVSAGKKGDSDHSQVSDDSHPDPSQLLSLTPEEERREREELLKVLGATTWSDPLQASLGEERRCYVREESYTPYTSSDDSDSEYDSDESISSQVSEDEFSQEGLDRLTNPDLQGSKVKEGSASRHSDEGDEETPVPRSPCTPVDQPRQLENKEQLTVSKSPTEVCTAHQEHEPGDDGADEAPTRPTPLEWLDQVEVVEVELVGVEDDTPERGPKRRRLDRQPAPKEIEYVERVVTMPKEEVLVLSDLLLRMFKHDPKERIDIDTVVNHEFWGDRRDRWLVTGDDSDEEIPDPISSRTRSRASKTEQGAESGSPQVSN